MKKIFVPFIISLLIVVGCSEKNTSTKAKDDTIGENIMPTVSMWLPEWQFKPAISEVKTSIVGLENIHVFGAYFNEDDQMFLTDSAIKLMEESKQQFSATNTIILTIVNDYVVAGSPSVQKDSKLLHRLLGSSQARQKHIENIIDLVDNYQVDGIEIDYEKIAKEDLGNYVLFLEELYQQLLKKNASLHVVLVPSFPFEISLPDGPKYTVMAYNVHGYHSGPGAKATFSFLDELIRNIGKSNQKFAVAFATGGFSWGENGKVVALTEIEAAEVLASAEVISKRDSASGALYFYYLDKNNQKNEVWYADTKTLQTWVNYANDQNIDEIILWRAGGLSSDTLNWIKKNEKK